MFLFSFSIFLNFLSFISFLLFFSKTKTKTTTVFPNSVIQSKSSNDTFFALRNNNYAPSIIDRINLTEISATSLSFNTTNFRSSFLRGSCMNKKKEKKLSEFLINKHKHR